MKLPREVSDDQAILLSDIFPTAWFGAKLAEIRPGDTVAVFGCGPVGLFAIASARLLGAGRILAVDTIASRLEMARAQGAEIIDYEKEDPVATMKELTGGIGVDRAIDAVGVDANCAHHGPAAKKSKEHAKDFARERKEIAPKTNPDGDNWHPGDGPSQVLVWAVESLAKAGSLGIIGVYSEKSTTFPVGDAMEKNLTIKMGNCNHRRYVPELVEMTRSGRIDPKAVLTQRGPLSAAIDAYKAFDRREAGWTKVELRPSAENGAPASASHPV